MQTYDEYWVMIASQLVPVAAVTPLATTVGDSPPATSVSDTPPASSGDGPAETTDSSIPLKRAATADIMVRLHGKG